MSYRLLVNAPSGEQAVIEVSETGGYFDPGRVLWDERTDGPMPAVTLGGMSRAGDALVFSESQLAVYQAARPFDRAGAARRIDDAVAEIYARFLRFEVEYTEREAQAGAYKAAGYTGTVPPRVAEFATPAGMAPKAAADLVLAQAVALRAAMGQLSGLRMRKYEVLRAPSNADAGAAAAEILAAIAAIGAQVS